MDDRPRTTGKTMRLRYSWSDLVTYPLLFLLLAPLAWNLVRIVLSFATASRE